ncbi:MAG: hypothetical protein ACFFDB_18420 [Promethearchaeota archaeon]
MIIKASRYSSWSSHYSEFILDITGTGDRTNPYLISRKNYYFDDNLELSLYNSTSYTKIYKITLKSLYIKNCENITISNISVKHLGLGHCSKITIENSKITKQLRIAKSNEINIVDSNIGKLFAFSGEQIFFSGCEIQKISRKSKAEIVLKDSIKQNRYEYNSRSKSSRVAPDFLLCKSCNSEVDLFSKFCHNCGFKLQ